nr:juvenile hormone acid O-methyltransferase-like [Leptinotarsa decemlineata]
MEVYGKRHSLQRREVSHALNKYFHLLSWKCGEKILEISPGDGTLTMDLLIPLLPKNFKHYIGINYIEGVTAVAQANFPNDKYPKITFVNCDIQEEFPGYSNEFDHVFALLCLHWMWNVRTAIQNIFEMMKPGGEILASFAEVSPVSDIFHNLSRNPKWAPYGHEKHISTFFYSENPLKDWIQTFTEAGFVDIKTSCEERTIEFPTEKNFEEVFLAIDPIFRKIPAEKKEEYLKDYFEEIRRGKMNYVEYSNELGKSVHKTTFNCVFLIAKKPS